MKKLKAQPPVRGGPEEVERAYRAALTELVESGERFLVGGAYALEQYTGIVRRTKDFDIFVLRSDTPRILSILAEIGFRTEITFPHWLAKARFGRDGLIDVIFSSGNGLCPVDEEWFRHSEEREVLGIPVRVAPPEEAIWQKAHILERDRADGADVAHIIRSRGPTLDWSRLLRRFGPYFHVLLSHLVLFRFIYPSEREAVPEEVMGRLLGLLEEERKAPPPKASSPSGKLCRGTLLSRSQYREDIEKWGYRDARLPPWGDMTPEEIERWDGTWNPHPQV